MKNHKPWTINAKSSSEIEILLYGPIGEDYWTGEGITAKEFADDLRAAGGISKIRLRVNSSGGNVMDGLAMYNTLLSHSATVTAQIDGVAASIAGVIVMSASEIDIGENSLLMIHNPSTLVAGDAKEMRKMAETLDLVKASMIRAYRRHCRKSEAEIGELMDSETWFSGRAAVEAGFAERVINRDEDESDDELAAAVRAPIFARFRRVPPRVAQIAARCSRDDGDEWRRRRSRQRAQELREMDLDTFRRETMAQHAIEISNMRAAAISDDLRRRLTMAARERELRAWRAADFVWEDCYVDGFRTVRRVEAIDRSEERHRLIAQREIELGGRKMPTFVVRVQL